jgi:hypothetical protein
MVGARPSRSLTQELAELLAGPPAGDGRFTEPGAVMAERFAALRAWSLSDAQSCER